MLPRAGSRALLLLFGAVLAKACAPEAGAPPSIAASIWIGYEPLYLAGRLFDREERLFRMVDMVSAGQVIRSVQSNAVELCALTLDEALTLSDADGNFRHAVALILDVSHGADRIIAQPEIPTFKHLKGKRVALEVEAVGAYVLYRALQLNGMSEIDVTLVPMDVSRQEEAFVSGSVDAIVTFTPISERLMGLGANSVFDSTRIPNEVLDVLLVEKNFYASNQERVFAIMSAWIKANQHLELRPAEATQMMAHRLRLSPSEIVTALGGVRLGSASINDELQGKDTELEYRAQALAEAMAESKLLSKATKYASLFEPDVWRDFRQSSYASLWTSK